MNEDNLREVLDLCNHKLASALLVKQFAGGIIPKDLGALLDLYLANPSTETATRLIRFDPKFIALFQLARRGGLAESQFRKGDLVIDTKTAKMLVQEPQFEKYCLSIADDPQLHKQLKEQLRSKGYSDKVIDDAFGEYWSDLASDA